MRRLIRFYSNKYQSNINIRIPRGTHGYRGASSVLRSNIADIGFGCASLYHFERLETPIIESGNLFRRALPLGDASAKEMFWLKRRDQSDEQADEAYDNDALALRPEGTAAVARHFIEDK